MFLGMNLVHEFAPISMSDMVEFALLRQEWATHPMVIRNDQCLEGWFLIIWQDQKQKSHIKNNICEILENLTRNVNLNSNCQSMNKCNKKLLIL